MSRKGLNDMDNSTIEKLATTEVTQFFLKNAEYVVPNIVDGDKGISFDGNLEFHSSENRNKISYGSTIKLQVKGTEVEQFDENEASFSKFDISDFKNFQSENGVIVFLVQILADDRTGKIYYAFLSSEILEDILLEFEETGKKTKTIKLKNLSSRDNIDDIFENIFLEMKSKSQTYIKAYRKVLGNPISNKFSSSIELDSVNSIAREIASVEYKKKDSEFNKNLAREAKSLLDTNIRNNLGLALFYNKYKNVKDFYEDLPEKNKILVSLVTARYLASQGDLIACEKNLEKIDGSFEPTVFRERIEMESLILELEQKGKTEEVVIEQIENKKTDNRIKNVYKILTYSASRNYKMAEYFLKKLPQNDVEWNYFSAIYYSELGRLKEAAVLYSKVYNELHFPEIKLNELTARFNNIMFSEFNTQIDSLDILAELNKLEHELEKYEGLMLVGLDELKFRVNVYMNPEDGISEIDIKLKENVNLKEYNDLILWKVKLLIRLKEYDQALLILSKIDLSELTSQAVVLKIQILKKQKVYHKVIEYIEEIIELDVINEDEDFHSYLINELLLLIKEKTKWTSKDFEDRISRIQKKVNFNFIDLLIVESIRKKILSNSQGKYFSNIISKAKDFDIYRYNFGAVANYFIEINNLELYEKLYEDFQSVDGLIAKQVYVYLLFNAGKIEKALLEIESSSEVELPLRLLQMKAKCYNALEQFSATIQLYFDNKIDDNDFLCTVLIAKINQEDSHDVRKIIDKLQHTDKTEYLTVVAQALVIFDIDIVKGVQLCEMLILRDHFENKYLNTSVVTLHLKNTQKIDDNLEVDKFEGENLDYLVFENEEKIIEKFIVIPNTWDISDFQDYHISKTNSELALQFSIMNIEDEIEIDRKILKLRKKVNLSEFIFQSIYKFFDFEGAVKIQLETKESGEIDVTSLLDFLEKSRREEEVRNKNIMAAYKKTHFPAIFEKIYPSDKKIEMYQTLFQDVSQRYYIGKTFPFSEDIEYQVTLSSLVFLQELELLDICTKYSNLIIESSSISWLTNHLTKLRRKDSEERISSMNGKILFYEKKDEEKQSDIIKITGLLVLVKKMKSNRAGFIQNKINDLSPENGASVQAAITDKLPIFIEDEAIQQILLTGFNISGGSIGSLICHYFLYREKNIDKLLDILIKVLDKNSFWIVTVDYYFKIEEYVQKSNDQAIFEKFNIWIKKYSSNLTN